MGNCLPRKRNVSEVLSLTPASLSSTSLRSEEELKMLENLSISDVEYTSVKTFVFEEDEVPGKVKSPIKFEVIDNQKVKEMPKRLASRMASRAASRMASRAASRMASRAASRMASRAASRMGNSRMEELKLTDEDELFMDEILEEYERKMRTAKLRREEALNKIREKARDLSYGPQSRVMKFEGVGEEGVGRGERG